MEHDASPSTQPELDVAHLLARRDGIMAAALRRMHTDLQATTSTIYLVTTDGRRLSAAMSVDTPVAFTVLPGMDVADRRHSTSTAYRTGEVVVYDASDVHQLVRNDPAILLKAPFPMVVVSAPLRTPARRLGAVTLRWVPPRPITADVLRHLTNLADALAGELDALVEQGLARVAPGVPLFISAAPPSEPQATQTASTHPQARDSAGPTIAGTTFLYQLVQLASELTAAVRPREVLSACWERMVRPFGGSAVMLCLAENGRLLAMGAAGFSKEAVRGVEGLPLSRLHPITDSIARIEPMFYESTQALRARYPDLASDEERAWAFLPLIAHGQATGCCVLGFPPPLRLNSQERALLLVMLEEVAQSLVRARSYDLEHALAQSVQRRLLPRSLPHLAEAEIAARYLPATTGAAVGGDWYDVVSLPGQGLGLVIGDVEGHSSEAAVIMGQIRSVVHAYAAEGHDPASLLTRSNRLLTELGTDLFATCCCLWLDLETGNILLASAGHPLPLIADRDESITEPALSVGPPLGVDPGTVYHQSEMDLPPGGIVALYTNGLLESRRVDITASEWLSRYLELPEGFGQNLELLADRLTDASQPEAQRDDDAALLLLRYQGASSVVPGRVARIWVQRHDLQSVARVRRDLRNLLREWNLDAGLDELELLATEVVTNALIHAHSDVDIRLRECPDGIRLEVRDSDPHPPMPVTILITDEAENRQAESGRGLLIVDAVASAWGSAPVGRGKVTWFELNITA